MTKRILSLMAAAAMVVSMTACSSNSGTPSSSADAGSNAGAELPSVTWKFSHTQAPDHFQHKVLEDMAAKVAEQTEGKFKIEIFHSGTLGAEQEVIEGMQMGTVSGTMSAVNLLGNFVPSYNLFALPALFADSEQMREVLTNEEIMSKMRAAAAEKNILEVGFNQDFFRQLFTKNPVTDVASLKGQKIRVMGSPILVESFQALGANPTTTAWAELYSGLQLGVVDGLDHVSTSVRTMNFFEHLGYACRPDLFPTPMFMVISKPLYDQLPAEYKTVLDTEMKAAMDSMNEQAGQIDTDNYEFLITEGGLKETEVDVAALHAAVAPVRDKYLAEMESWVQDIAKTILEK